jgi:hypothetical protein
MTVAELGRRMTSREFSAWQAFAAVEPFGSGRDDLRAGTIASLIGNVYRNPQSRPEPFAPGDFFPEIAPPKPKPDIRTSWEAWAERHNAARSRKTIKRKR